MYLSADRYLIMKAFLTILQTSDARVLGGQSKPSFLVSRDVETSRSFYFVDAGAFETPPSCPL